MSMSQPARQRITEQLQRHKPFRVCLVCEVEPKLSIKDGKFIFWCADCGWRSGGFDDLQAAITDWHRSNRPNDSHIGECWQNRLKQQRERLHV